MCAHQYVHLHVRVYLMHGIFDVSSLAVADLGVKWKGN